MMDKPFKDNVVREYPIHDNTDRWDSELFKPLKVGPFSIVIPAFNEVLTIGSTLAQIDAVVSDAELDCEIIVVDDGSSDGTAEEVTRQPGVRLIKHHRNMGYGAALKTGIRQALNDIIVIIDADGTYPPASQMGSKHVGKLFNRIRDSRLELRFACIQTGSC